MRAALIVTLAAWLVGCHKLPAPDYQHRLWDITFHRRSLEPFANYNCDPFMQLAREVTVIEDDIRRDGTITIKTPDVWGDGNLLQFIQEYERVMSKDLDTKFTETLQAFISRSDQMELQSTTALGDALSSSGNGNKSDSSATVNTIDLKDEGLFAALKDAVDIAKPSQKIGIEPTELDRQRSVFLSLNQALRRRAIGDDQSRAAGYGLYMFRIPVSILPGRETNRNYAAAVTLRARMEIDRAHLEYAFARLMIADTVDAITPWVNQKLMRKADRISQLATLVQILTDAAASEKNDGFRKDLVTLAALGTRLVNLEQHSRWMDPGKWQSHQLEVGNFISQLFGSLTNKEMDAKPAAALELALGQFLAQFPVPIDNNGIQEKHTQRMQYNSTLGSARAAPILPDIEPLFGQTELFAVLAKVHDNFVLQPRDSTDAGGPKDQEIRDFLFDYLESVLNALDPVPERVAQTIQRAADHANRKKFDPLAADRCELECYFAELGAEPDFPLVASILALQNGLLDANIKQMLEALRVAGKLPESLANLINLATDTKDPNRDLYFFDLDNCRHAEEAVALWQILIQENFPIHVFSLEPQVEEQNTYDAFARNRELQLALAYNVAKGVIGVQQKVAMSRRLALEMADIGVNRTAVAFAHGNDTFGWYFYPRTQPPPAESSNLAALGRMIWSTGPTEHYDKKHRNLEPGMRECEVLVAMPDFIDQVAFDVTTNWERITKPGVTKRSYEEMILQGSRIQQLRSCLGESCNPQMYRAGEFERLVSRIDQLEQMLGLQTYRVNLPYDYEQSGSDLFDTGKDHLRPLITGFYGLDYLEPDTKDDAFLFITGKNFHPTLTHVVVGGTESHSLASAVHPAGEAKTAEAPSEKSAGEKPAADAASKDSTSAKSEAAKEKTAPSAAPTAADKKAGDVANNNVAPDVEVISRDLIRVRISSLHGALAREEGFTIRVGTPAGLSNPLLIPRQKKKTAATEKPSPTGQATTIEASAAATFKATIPPKPPVKAGGQGNLPANDNREGAANSGIRLNLPKVKAKIAYPLDQ
jgi:hypothetical protein